MNNWLSPLWDLLSKFNPCEMVPEYHWAVRFTLGKCEKKPLRTGLNFRLPFFQEIVEVARVPEVWQFDTQTVGTKDGKSVTLAANVELLILDPVTLNRAIYKWEQSLRGEITGHITEYINARAYDEVMTNGGLEKLQNSLATKLSRRIKDWGLKIERVSFNEFGPTTQSIRIYSDQPVKLG